MRNYFEQVKRAAFNVAINTTEFKQIPLFDTILGKKPTYYPNAIEEARKELNTALDNWDIRSVNQLIDVLPLKKSGVPSWIRQKQFVIDMDENGKWNLFKK